MKDIRLEELPFDFRGKTYYLRCNMNVLADVQDAFDGQLGNAMSGANTTRSVLEFLAAMLNDYAEEKGWPDRFTSRDVGRQCTPGMIPAAEIMGLVTRAIAPPSPVSGADTEEKAPDSDAEDPGESGN